jgi:hypothetical protein
VRRPRHHSHRPLHAQVIVA